MSWHRASIFLVAAGWWIASCKGEQSSTDGNTSWLRSCDNAAQCGGGFECVCGVCTRSCSDIAACSDLDPHATCAPGGATCAGAPICTLACEQHDDCTTRNASLECVAGACELLGIGHREAGSTGGGPTASGGAPMGTGGSTGGAAGGSGGTSGTGGTATGGATSQPTDAGNNDAGDASVLGDS